MKTIVFDIEATDLVPGQICQLSYLIVHGGEVYGKNMFFAVNEMNEDARAVHGMSIEDLDLLSGGKVFSDRAQEIYADFNGCGLMVGHNIAADDRYLREEFSRLNMPLKKIRTFCTMNYFTSDAQLPRKVNTGRPKPPKLSELIVFFGLRDEDIVENARKWFGGAGALHDARYDAAATYMCLAEAAKRGKVRGVI